MPVRVQGEITVTPVTKQLAHAPTASKREAVDKVSGKVKKGRKINERKRESRYALKATELVGGLYVTPPQCGTVNETKF